LKADDKKFNKDLEGISKSLVMHIAAMKPTYLAIEDIPAEVINKIKEEGGEKGDKDV
jgi:translation elongation factor EF-Ts